ncbi:MAG: hypothetical protein K1X90_13715 [Candidatus Kapabacteria bacterium]|nr:hypothetical protein [Candidatus Kapabacteria bacterium]
MKQPRFRNQPRTWRCRNRSMKIVWSCGGHDELIATVGHPAPGIGAQAGI